MDDATMGFNSLEEARVESKDVMDRGEHHVNHERRGGNRECVVCVKEG